LCDIEPPRRRIASQQSLRILSNINREFFAISCDGITCDNVATPSIRAFNLNWGNALYVWTSYAIGMHRSDVGCDGAAIGWLQ
jgi:hypothetical protein